MTILAWHSNADLKAEVMERLRRHRADDAIVQGIYQHVDPAPAVGYRGCAIGCTLPFQPQLNFRSDSGAWHKAVEDYYGIPAAVADAIDFTFEDLDPSDAGDFAVRVAEALPVGSDLLAALRAFNAERETWPVEQWQPTPMAERLIHHLSNAPIPVAAS